ncbi:hypothetical protein N9192_02180 [Akkermansiaceae bacterium]|nr:hypothetical protein [Akkermansiaceae bacterium]MDB4541682.1 hypothetical protein [Akkermansiaceae bacterium]
MTSCSSRGDDVEVVLEQGGVGTAIDDAPIDSDTEAEFVGGGQE